MKSMVIKSIIVGLVSVACVSTASAWQCRVHNAKGQVWMGSGATRAAASSNAMRFCSNNSTYMRNCVIDWCNGGAPGPMPGVWQCNVANARGQSWYGTGPSRSAAASNAIRFCSQGSNYARNCVITSCFTR